MIPMISNEVMKSVLPCIVGESSKCEEKDIAIGSSKFCGNPDVPENFSWPMTKDGPCWFIGQLNLNEIGKFNTKVKLPEEGLLSFFYHDEGGPAGSESRVYLFPMDSLTRAEIVKDIRWGEGFHDKHFYPRNLTFSQGYSLPSVKNLNLSAEHINEYDELDDIIENFMDTFCNGTHQFLGVPRYLWDKPLYDTMLANFGQLNDRIRYFFDKKNIEKNDFTNFQVIYDCT